MPRQIPVFYHPNQVAHPEGTLSPSASKPELVVAAWQAAGYPIRIESPEPVSRDQLAAAHERSYVDGVLNLTRHDGFGNKKADVAASFPWTSGSFLCASRAALSSHEVAVSPTSGFHHAGYTRGGGFCTFNGLMVAAVSLLRDGAVKQIGILDCDQHYGDGTEDIIERLKLRAHIQHVTAGAYPMVGEQFLAHLHQLAASFSGCDLLMYQAGADPHVDDPLGGYLTTEQLLERDRIVFQTTARLGIPVVWNLAGGYQKPIGKVLEIHNNTMQACVEAYFDPNEDVLAEPSGQPNGRQM